MRWLTERRWVGVAAAAVLFAAIFAVRVTVGTLADALGFLYVIPVVLVATALGTRAGLLAGGVAFALSSLGADLANQPTSTLGYFNRALVLLFVGALTGRFATTMRALEAESARHFNLSLDMICTAGFDGRFRSVNPAFEQILGYRPDELIGQPFLDFVHAEDRERTEREAASPSEGAKTVQFQNRYLAKDGSLHWLEWTSIPLRDKAIIYAVARDITERKALEQELELLSQHDSLTGLFNRRRFEEELRRQLAYTRRYGRGGALLMIDLDRFKQINDELGHATGDRALCQVAAQMRDNLRGSDVLGREAAKAVHDVGDAGLGTGLPADAGAGAFVARLGGDEFVALLPEADEAGAAATAERLAAAVRGTPLEVDGLEVPLRVSIGVATFDEHGLPGELDLLAAADRAMYAAKARGGGTELAPAAG
jgi:PAS domain S-box-containing protein